MDLNKQLADHLTPQSFTGLRQLAPRFGRARLAGQANIETELRIVVFGGVHGKEVLCRIPYVVQRPLRWVSDVSFAGIAIPLYYYPTIWLNPVLP
jgi:hypothetical protein